MKVLLLHQNSRLRNTLATLFRNNSDSNSEFHCINGARQALRQICSLKIDVLICDVQIPGFELSDFISKAKQAQPSLSTMIVTQADDSASVFMALKAGASSYMLTSSSPETLLHAIYELHNGGAPMTPEIARIVVQGLHSDSMAAELSILTSREKQVFKCMEAGCTYKGISAQLNITANTVHTHIKNIYGKLQAENKLDALNKAKTLAAA